MTISSTINTKKKKHGRLSPSRYDSLLMWAVVLGIHIIGITLWVLFYIGYVLLEMLNIVLDVLIFIKHKTKKYANQLMGKAKH